MAFLGECPEAGGGGVGLLLRLRGVPVLRLASVSGALLLAEAATAFIEGRVALLPEALRRSISPLSDWAGTPAEDWMEFPPPGLGHGTGWSDWLSFLLARSRTGVLGATLFGGKPASFGVVREVTRERKVDGNYIYDMLIDLGQRRWIHVEVKIGDQDFGKTYETATGLRRSLGSGASVRDFILLPESDLDSWSEVAEGHGKDFEFQIVAVPWRNVAIGIRRTLTAYSGKEDRNWESWAHAFCGAIEQDHRTMGVPCVLDGSDFSALRRSRTSDLATLLDVVEKGPQRV